MKVYLLYLKKTGSLYAYTLNKDYVSSFLSQRNPDLFHEVIESMDEIDLALFMNSKKGLQLINDYVSDEETTYEIITTVDESVGLSESCEEIESTCRCIEQQLHLWKLKPKYLKIIKKLTHVISVQSNIDTNPTLNVNTLKLFYSLYKETFTNEIWVDED